MVYLEVAKFDEFKKENAEQIRHILNKLNQLNEWNRRTNRETSSSNIDSQQFETISKLKSEILNLQSQLETIEFELLSQKTECDTLKKKILNGELIERPRSTEDLVKYASYLTQGLGKHLSQIFGIQAVNKSFQPLPPSKASAILENIVYHFIQRKKMAKYQETIDLHNINMFPQDISAAPPSHTIIESSFQATMASKSQNVSQDLIDLFEDDEIPDEAKAPEREANMPKKSNEAMAIVLNSEIYRPKISVPHLYPYWQRRNNHKDTIHFLNVESIIEFLYAMPWRILIEQHQEYRILSQSAVNGIPLWAKYHEANIEFQIKWVVERFEMMWHIPIPNQIELTKYSQEDIGFFMRYDEDRKKRRLAYKAAATKIADFYNDVKKRYKDMDCEKMLMDPGYQIPPDTKRSCGWAPSDYDLLFNFATKAAKYPGSLYHTANRFTHPFYKFGYYELFPPSKNTSSVLKKAGTLKDYGYSMLEEKFEWLFTDAIRQKYDLNMIKARAEKKWKYYESILIVKSPEPAVNGTLSSNQKAILQKFPIPALKFTRCMFYNRITNQIQDNPVDPDSNDQAPINVPNAAWKPNNPFKTQPVHHKVNRMETNANATSARSSDSRSIVHKRLFDSSDHQTRNTKKCKASKPLSYEDDEDTE